MASTVECKCENCRKPFVARVADRKRCWARFCSKSCKALKQERRTGQCADYFHRRTERYGYRDGEFADAHLFSNEEHDCNKD